MIIRKFGIFSCAKVSAILYAALGFLLVIFASMFSLTMGAMMPDTGQGSELFGLLFGVGAIIFLPLFYGVFGFIAGAIGAWLYNVIAGFAGGIEVEFEQEPTSTPVGSGV